MRRKNEMASRSRSQNADSASLQAKFMQGVALYQQGKLTDTERINVEILEQQPNHFDALHLLGVIALQTRRTERGVELIKKAIALNKTIAVAHNNLGNGLRDLNHSEEALASYDKAIALKPDYALAYGNRGNALRDLKRSEAALASYNKAIALKPDYAEAYSNRGNALRDLNRFEEALASYNKAIALKPDYAEAYNNRGNALRDLNRSDEALASYNKAIALKPDYGNAWLGCGSVFYGLQRYDKAIAAFAKVEALKTDLAESSLCRGHALKELKRYDEAFAAYDKALAVKPDLEGAWLGRGNIFSDLRRYDEAFSAYDKAFALKPDLDGVEGNRLHTKMRLCDWGNFDAECEHLIPSVRNANVNTPPFPFLTIPSFSDDQLQCAKLWIANKYPPYDKPIWRGERYNHKRIRIAYLSADFCEHPVSFLIAGMFECHDKSRFDITAISFGPDDNSEIRQRLMASSEHFIDTKTYRDDQIANLVRSLEVDILVDLMGFTADSRTGIFARRSAPIQVNYLGYPGTMGAEYIDYIIADGIVIPEDQHGFYAEKIVVLPNSFLPTDRKRRIPDKVFTRAEVGLPQEGFVFCSFNDNYKITPDVYGIWMQILRKVDSSVLWLFAENSTVKRNLIGEAAARGVDAERLIFAPRMPLPEHQARLSLADLFLDTLPYNAGATASDILWAGLPVLTRMGDTFVGRMAASVLNAIDLPELITTTPEGYQQSAIDLATHPEKLAKIKQKLAGNRLTTPLFDTKLFTRHIEAAYIAMYGRHQAGLAPDHIAIPN